MVQWIIEKEKQDFQKEIADTKKECREESDSIKKSRIQEKSKKMYM